MLKPRPARLGLGAKFLSHNKAMAAMGEVEKRLSQRIKRTQEDIKEPEQASTSGSDEEEGAAARRSNAARAPVQPKKTARAGFSKSQLISELAARKEQDTEVPKKKRRKKKKKKTSHQVGPAPAPWRLSTMSLNQAPRNGDDMS